MKQKTPVALRMKPLKNGSQSLYLDIYIQGKRTRETLGLYINPGNDPMTKARNRNAMQAAEVIRSKRILELQNNKAGLACRRDISVSDYFEIMMENKSKFISKSNTSMIRSLMAVWFRYQPNANLQDVDKDMALGFCKYIRTAKKRTGKCYHPNTCNRIYITVAMVFKEAKRDGYIEHSPFENIRKTEIPHTITTTRNYLNIDEVRLLADTPCPNDTVKRMFMFACFTGFRHSDIIRLKWSDISNGAIRIYQQKTDTPVDVPLSVNAIRWLPENKGGQLIFEGAPTLASTTYDIRIWVARAGITKHITFHCSRHTFATLELTYGADIYTVSKLLGHTDIATTQVYAKIIDKKKREAIDLIPDL